MSGGNDADQSLSAAAYGRLRRATETHREELVVRLAGEVGLRPAEIARVRPRDVTTHDDGRVDHYFLQVPDGDGDTDRVAYLPADVEHDLRQYARTAGVDDDERLVAVTPRRVQMLVADVGERAADRTGDERLREVSSRTLRRYFARHLLREEGVDARAVKTVGGWERLSSLDPFVDDADRSEVAAAFADTSLAPADPAPTPAGEASGRVDAALDRVRALGDALAGASTREEIERRVCETLAAGDAYEAAWVAREDGDSIDVTAVAGVPEDAFDQRAGAVVGAAVRSGEVRATDDVYADAAFADWRPVADSAGFRAAAAVPIDDGETTYGAFGVGVDADALADRERRLLADAGRRAGRAVTIAQQRRLMLADTVLEVAFETTGGASLFAAAAAEHGCEFELDGLVPGEADSLIYFVRLSGAPPEAVLSWAADHDGVADGRLVQDYGDGALLELVVTGADVAKAVTEYGASVREMAATPAGQRVVGDVSTNADVRALLDRLAADFPAVELVSKRERSQNAETPAGFRASLHESLTDKQAAVLRAAFHAGYFEWPRGTTAEELADAIGITSPTLHNHLRRAQQKLLSAFFEDEDAGLGGTEWPGD
ncbi:MAG: bacterio-opsin activator domain-containing protein [Halobacterium sp.]